MQIIISSEWKSQIGNVFAGLNCRFVVFGTLHDRLINSITSAAASSRDMAQTSYFMATNRSVLEMGLLNVPDDRLMIAGELIGFPIWLRWF